MLPPVCIVCPNLSSNSLGRALVLAELAARETQVRVVGVRRGPEIWPPAQRASFPIEEFPLTHDARYSPRAVTWLRRTVRNDLVVVSKPLPHSLGLSLAAGIDPRRTVVDVDDWESGFYQSGANEARGKLHFWMDRARSYGRRFGLNAFVLTRALEEAARRMPHRIVSNRWLQRRFGGDVLYHVRDETVMDNHLLARSEGESLPRNRIWVAFVGTPRPHKGLDILASAIELQTGINAPGLVVMGASASDPSIARIRQRLGDRFICTPQFDFSELPSRLALADIIAVPSLNVPAAWGQIPAKLFDGLAMGKPLVVSDVNEMARLVDGCGISVPAGDARALGAAITTLASDHELRARLGGAGRRRFLAQFTYAEGLKVLGRVLRAAAKT